MNNVEHIGTFATVTRDGNNSGGRNGGRGRGGRSGRGGGQGRGNQSRQPVYDEDGKACCFDYMDNQCKRGKDCRWSHKKPKPQEVTSGKGPAVDQDLQNAIAKLRGSKGTIALAKSEPSNGGDPGDA